jgi:hypothetical protein
MFSNDKEACSTLLRQEALPWLQLTMLKRKLEAWIEMKFEPSNDKRASVLVKFQIDCHKIRLIEAVNFTTILNCRFLTFYLFIRATFPKASTCHSNLSQWKTGENERRCRWKRKFYNTKKLSGKLWGLFRDRVAGGGLRRGVWQSYFSIRDANRPEGRMREKKIWRKSGCGNLVRW